MEIQEGISVMPLVTGDDLDRDSHLHSFSYGSHSQVSMAAQLMKEINLLHREDILHRDIKPANIIWDTNENIVKLVDFDLAQKLEEGKELFQTKDSSDKTFMAPECVKETVEFKGYTFSKASDVYSAGLVLRNKIDLNKPHLSYIDLLLKAKITEMLAADPKERPTIAECEEYFNKVSKINDHFLEHPNDKHREQLGKSLVNLELYINKNQHHEIKASSVFQKLKLTAHKTSRLFIAKQLLTTVLNALAKEPIDYQSINKNISKLEKHEKKSKGILSRSGYLKKILLSLKEIGAHSTNLEEKTPLKSKKT